MVAVAVVQTMVEFMVIMVLVDLAAVAEAAVLLIMEFNILAAAVVVLVVLDILITEVKAHLEQSLYATQYSMNKYRYKGL
jgi:hypothetical protein